MKTTKDLNKELQNKSAFAAVWAYFWRFAVIYVGGAFIIGLLYGLLTL